MKKHYGLASAISTTNVEVRLAILFQLMYEAGRVVNDTLSRMIRGDDVVVMDQMLADAFGFDGEDLVKPVHITDAVTLYQAVLVALVGIAKTPVDGKFPYKDRVLGVNSNTGKPRIMSLIQRLEDSAAYRVSRALEQAELQFAALRTAGAITSAEEETARTAIRKVREEEQKADLELRKSYLGDHMSELKSLMELSDDDLNEIIVQKAEVCNLSKDLAKETAQRQCDFAVERLLKGKYVNIDPELALMAKSK